MTAYAESIIEATNCTADDAVMIEYITREEIFHSTLDWQSRIEFNRAARKAAKILAGDREVYEEYFRLGSKAYAKLHAENEAIAKAVAYEI